MLTDNPLLLGVTLAAMACAALLFGTGAFQLWLTSILANAKVPLGTLLRMKLRSVEARDIVSAYIVCRKAEVPVTIQELEALYLSAPTQFVLEVQKLVAEHMRGRTQ